MLRVLLVAVLLLSTLTSQSSAEPRNAPPAERGAPPFPEDSRLSKEVSVDRARIYLGELAELLSRQGRVSLTVDDAKGAVSGIDLTVFLSGRPLRDVMTGLEELLSTRQDPWEWQRRGNGYILRHQQSPEAATEAARREIQNRWAGDLQELYRVAKLPDTERLAGHAANPEIFPAAHLEGVGMGKLDLLAALNPTQVAELARGGRVEIDTSHLSARARQGLTLGVTGERPASAPPAFYVKWDVTSLSPILWLSNGAGASNVCGGPGWDGAWLQSDNPGWKGFGAPDVQDLALRMIDQEEKLGSRVPDRTLPAWLMRAAVQQRFDILADHLYPRWNVTTSAAWMGVDRIDTLRIFVMRGHYVWREHGPIHLLRANLAGLHPRRHLVSWPEIRAMREAAAANDGYLDLPQLLHISALSPDQQFGLAEEFPDLKSNQAHPLAEWSPILRFYAELDPRAQAQVRRTEGLRYADAGIVARGALEFAAGTPGEEIKKDDFRGRDLLARHPKDAAVRLRLESGVDPERKPYRTLVWEVEAPGEATVTRNYRLRPREPLLPEEGRVIKELPSPPARRLRDGF